MTPTLKTLSIIRERKVTAGLKTLSMIRERKVTAVLKTLSMIRARRVTAGLKTPSTDKGEYDDCRKTGKKREHFGQTLSSAQRRDGWYMRTSKQEIQLTLNLS